MRVRCFSCRGVPLPSARSTKVPVQPSARYGARRNRIGRTFAKTADGPNSFICASSSSTVRMPREAYTPGYDPSPSATPSVSFLGQSQNREMQEAPYEEEVEAPFDSKRPPLQFDPPRLLHSPKIAIEPFELREDRKKNAELRNRQRRAALGPDAWMPPRVAVIKPLSHPGTPNMSKRLAIRASAHELAASLRPTPMPSPSKKFFEDKRQAKPAKQVIPSYRLRVLAELLVFEPEFYKALKQASAEDVWVLPLAARRFGYADGG